jgi:hypothetical protein
VLTPVILATQEDRHSKPSPANSFSRHYLERTHHKKGLMEWPKI